RNLIHIARDVVEQAHEVVAMADRRAGRQVLAERGDRGNAGGEQHLRNDCAVAQDDRARRQNDRLLLVHRGECAGVALLGIKFDHARLEAEIARRLGCRFALLARRRVESDGEDARARKRLPRNLDAVGGELDLAHEDAGAIAAGAREARHIAFRQRIEIEGEKRDRLALRCRERGTQRKLVADGEKHVDLARRELAIVLFVAFDIRGLDVIEGEVAAFLIAELGQPLEKIYVDGRVAGLNADISEAQHLWLLRACRKRPRRGGACEQRYERAAAQLAHVFPPAMRRRKAPYRRKTAPAVFGTLRLPRNRGQVPDLDLNCYEPAAVARPFPIAAPQTKEG